MSGRIGAGLWLGLLVWAASLSAARGVAAEVEVLEPWERADTSAAGSGAKGLVLSAPRNGFASGLVVVTAPAAVGAVTAVPSDLKNTEGAILPGAAVRVRYGNAAGSVYGLLDKCPDVSKKLAVWLTVNVPAEAQPGFYRGTLALRGGATASVPVSLTVYGWQIASPRDWKTSVNLLQSPESVAGYYKVPLWSDRHFKLLEKSFGLMAECGNDVLGIQAVGRNYLGDDPVIVFCRQGGKYVPEFKYCDRYLELYNKIAGQPKFLAVQVWSYPVRGGRETGKEPVLIHEIQGDKLALVESPYFGAPGTEETWRAVLDGVRERVKKLGWREEGLLLGTTGDSWPIASTIEFWNKAAPGVEWRTLTHGCGCPKWGPSRDKRTQPNGQVTGLLEIARWIHNWRPYLADHPVTSNSRDHIGMSPFDLFALPGFNAKGGYFGYAWKGLDYWTFTTPEGRSRNVLNFYVGFGNVIGSTPRALSAPGPEGALATPQFEMLREGTQVLEALWAIRDNLDKLRPQAVDVCDVAEVFLRNAMKSNAADDSGRELEVTLIFHKGEIVVRPYAPTWNTSGPGTGQAKFTLENGVARFEIDFHLGDDQWVKGGDGRFVGEAKLNGEELSGTHKGTFKDIAASGTLRGNFRPKAYQLPVGERPPKTEFDTRCEAAITEFFQTVNLDGKRSGDIGERARLREMVNRLYVVASESARRLAEKGTKQK